MSVYFPPVEQHETVIKAALRSIEATHYSRADDPHADAEHQYSDEQLALAARALAEAVDQLPEDKQPIGWSRTAEPAPDLYAAFLAAVEGFQVRSNTGLSYRQQFAQHLLTELAPHIQGDQS